MKFDDILVEIGEFGRYQRYVFVPLCLIGIPAALTTLAAVFLNAKPDHWCAVESWSDEVDNCYSLYRDSDTDAYLSCLYQYRNASIPIALNDDVYEFEQCAKYDVEYPENYFPGYMAGALTDETIKCDEGWVFDQNQYKSSITTDYELVCEQKNLPDLAQSIYFFGILVGSFTFGVLADIIGRRLCFFTALVVFTVPGVVLAFSPSFWLYVVLRFLLGAGNIGVFLIAFVIGTELVGPSYRVLAGIMMQITFAVGYVLLTVYAYFIRDWRTLQFVMTAPTFLFFLLIPGRTFVKEVYAYFIRDWRTLQFVMTAPTFLFFLLIPFLPESARWLIARQKYDKAEKIIRKAAKVNKKELPPDFMEAIIRTEQENNSTAKQGTVLDLFKTRNLRLRTLNLMFNWWVINLVYYGLSLSTSDLGSNDYVTSLISAGVEIPAYLICIPAMNSFLGRRLSIVLAEIIGGVACLLTIFFELGAWRTSIAMIGKFMISAAFGIIYTFSAEVFPTPLRTIGMGVCSTCSRIGSMLAPVINLLDEVWLPLPLVVFGCFSLLAGLLALPLPETRGKKLPETIEEGESFGMKTLEVKHEEETKVKDVATMT